jgi:uncharacterized protein (DUF2141 family)
MKSLLLAGFVSACTLAAQPNPGAGSIEGHVFNSLTSAPVRKATVTLTTPQIRLVAETDADARFQFTGLPPGTYKISASHSGFLNRPARRPVRLGQDDHITDAEIRLPPQGVITGRVLDEDGDPVGGARVMLIKQVYRDGRKQWDRLNAITLANDAVEYRFPNLTPGRYLVEAETQRPMVDNRYGDRDLPDKPKMVYVPAYYPNAPSQQAALPVEVGVGAEVRGIDVHLFKLALPPLFHVSGKVTGMPPDSQVIIAVNLVPAGGAAFGGSTLARPPDYAFDLSLRPGQYTIFAHVYSGGPEAFATGTVTVARNVTNLVVTMSPPPDVTGRISLAESRSHVNLQGVRVTLGCPGPLGSSADVRSDTAGKLVFPKPISPGHCAIAVDVRSIPDGCFVQEVKLGGQDVSTNDLEILTSTQLEIVLSNKAGKVTGSVLDGDGKPFPNSSVTLIPQDGNSRPVRQSVDDDGAFKFTALRPGKYKLFAWEEVDDGVWQDPEFQKQYENRATEITVGPSETQSTQPRVIAADEMK